MKSERGFSLMELMVSIVIVTTLVGFIVPNVVDYFRQARVTTLQYQIRTMRSAIAKYAKDHHGAYPRSLNRLVDEGYLAEIPQDPFARTGDTWELAVGSMETSLGLYGKRKHVLAQYSDGAKRNYGPYHILQRQTASPYYDPPAGDPAVVPGAVTRLYWSNMGIVDVRSGATVFKDLTDANLHKKKTSYQSIDSQGYNWLYVSPVAGELPENSSLSPLVYSAAAFDN